MVFLADLMCSSRVRFGEGDLLRDGIVAEGGRVEFGIEEEELYAGSRSVVAVGALGCVEGRGDPFSCEGIEGRKIVGKNLKKFIDRSWGLSEEEFFLRLTCGEIEK
jgi:hypothetical protein